MAFFVVVVIYLIILFGFTTVTKGFLENLNTITIPNVETFCGNKTVCYVKYRIDLLTTDF